MMREAHSNKPQPRFLDIPDEMKGIEAIIDLDKAIEEGEEYTLENIFGIEQVYFPPENRLTDAQVHTLLDAILELWRVFHYEAVFRKGEFSERQQYTKLVEYWKHSAPKMRYSNGTWYFEMFDYEKYWDEDEMRYLTEDEYFTKYPITPYDPDINIDDICRCDDPFQSQKQEYREKLDTAAANPNNIHGIFNWCDRWCEKCSQTERCTLFQSSQRMSETESKDDFFEQLTVIFSATMDMLKEQAERLGIDFDNLKDAGIEKNTKK
jgi:hypothetical protein